MIADVKGGEAAPCRGRRALAQVRDLSNPLRPSVLDDLGQLGMRKRVTART